MTTPLERQEGGDHYRKLAIQPIEFIMANKLGFIEGNVIKYVTRHRDKHGATDIRKAIHYLELLLELEYASHTPAVETGVLSAFKAAFTNAFFGASVTGMEMETPSGLNSGPPVLKPGDEGYER